ncbi:MAG: 3-oxoacyl-[acyl-carrier protein] reductase, partial [Litorivivens sp.]
MRLANRVAIITGGASGMGLASVNRFLEEGASVVIADFNEDTGQAAIAAA